MLMALASIQAALPAHFTAEVRRHVVPAVIVTLVFALLAHRMRSVNRTGAIAGGMVSFLLYVTAGVGGFLTLGALFLLTTAGTRLGHTRKHRLGIDEGRHGRTAWQVLANLGVAAVLSTASLYTNRRELLLAAVAALAEAATDTTSSEVGKARSIHTYLITSFRRAEVGTDGGISFIGTLSGIVAGGFIVLVAAWSGMIPQYWIAPALGAAILGGLVDSLLGATLQRRGWLSNSGVNLVSTIAAAALAIIFLL